MGQKAHPIGIRLGINKSWLSSWFAKGKEFKDFLHADIKIRKFLESRLKNSGVAKVVIEREANQVVITIHTSKPGIIIGRGGEGIENLQRELKKLISNDVKIEIYEVSGPETSASLIAQNIASQIEKRISWRRAVKQAIARAEEKKVEGVKIVVSGRLGGAEMARSEKFTSGKMPLQTLKADIDYAFCQARTTYGVIGVKVWVYKKEKKE